MTRLGHAATTGAPQGDPRSDVSIIRVAKRDRYSVIANEALEDSRLSWKARGLLAYLLSKPDGWTVNRDQLTAASDADGQTTVRSGLRELEACGYLVRVRTRTSAGLFEWHNEIHERSSGGFPTDGFCTGGECIGGQPTGIVSTDSVSTEEAITEHQTREAVASRKPFEAEFNETWKEYPRKHARLASLRAYQARRRAGVTADDLHAATVHYARDMQAEGRELDKIMHGSTFYGPNERWRDYLEQRTEEPGWKAAADAAWAKMEASK